MLTIEEQTEWNPEEEARGSRAGESKQPAETKKAPEAAKKTISAPQKSVSAAKARAEKKKSAAKVDAEKASARKASSPATPPAKKAKKRDDGKAAPAPAVLVPAAALVDEGKPEQEADLSSARLPESPVLEDSLRHGRHVAMLVASLFDQLIALHKLDELWRNRLVLAARLHDIGFTQGRKGHHKASMRYIEEDLSLNISDEDRPLVALLARYHRKAWPSRRHRRFAALPGKERKALRRAASLLRIADGLDYTRGGLVKGCAVEIRPRKVVFTLDCAGDCAEEKVRAVKKGDLFTHLFGRELEYACQAG